MITFGKLRAFLRDQDGISSVEFTLVAFVFLMMVLAILDFSRAMWEWNRAAKATQAGVRHAVVIDLVAPNFRTYDGTTDTAIGTSVPAGLGPTPNPTVCTNAGCGADETTSSIALDAKGQAAFDAILAWMQAHDNLIGPDNVVIEYRHVGLGMAGCPGCPDIDPMVTVRLRDMDFFLITPGLAQIASPIAMPSFAATLSGEDGHTPVAP
jgi:Flp pilus assembly pilin Flp